MLGKHRLLCGDSSKAEDVDRLLDGAAIQLVNTDPPYNVKVEPRSNNAIATGLSSFPADARPHYHGFDLARDAQKGTPTTPKLRAKDRPLANDFVSDEEFDRLLHAWFGNLARVLRPGRAAYIWGGRVTVRKSHEPAGAAATARAHEHRYRLSGLPRPAWPGCVRDGPAAAGWNCGC